MRYVLPAQVALDFCDNEISVVVDMYNIYESHKSRCDAFSATASEFEMIDNISTVTLR